MPPASMLLSEYIKYGTSSLSALYPIEEAHSAVTLLCCELLGTRPYTHILEPGYLIPRDKLQPLEEALARLQEGEPLQYVTGSAWFCGRRFKVAPGVLIPRPETELLCREALLRLTSPGSLPGPSAVSSEGPSGAASGPSATPSRVVPGPSAVSSESPSGAASGRVLDLCTGSGCIAWTIALDAPSSEVTAVDISPEALSIARSQDFTEELAGIGAKAPVFIEADVLAPDRLADVFHSRGQAFDLILCNPPYIMESEKGQMRPNVLDYEPAGALFVPDDDPLLFYRAVSRIAGRLLAPGGTGIVEINETLGKETLDLFQGDGFGSCSLLQDLNGKDRFVIFSA